MSVVTLKVAIFSKFCDASNSTFKTSIISWSCFCFCLLGSHIHVKFYPCPWIYFWPFYFFCMAKILVLTICSELSFLAASVFALSIMSWTNFAAVSTCRQKSFEGMVFLVFGLAKLYLEGFWFLDWQTYLNGGCCFFGLAIVFWICQCFLIVKCTFLILSREICSI